MRSALVLLIGAPGAGKSALLAALSTLLEREGVRHGALESEQLAQGWPLLAASDWIGQLGAVLARQREAGRRIFLVAATTERESELRELLALARAQIALVVCLRVEPASAAQRVAAREPERWPGRRALIEHARELAPAIPHFAGIDLLLDSEALAPEALAIVVREEMRARGILARPTRS